MPSDQSTSDISLNITSHALKRWNERSDVPKIYPGSAWNEAATVVGTDLDADEVRYHSLTGTLLLRKDTSLVTVIDVETTSRQTRTAIDRFRAGGSA